MLFFSITRSNSEIVRKVKLQKSAQYQKFTSIYARDDHGYAIVKIVAVIFEILTLSVLLITIDIFAAFGYINVNGFFYLSKYLVWIVFVLGMYFRMLCVLRHNTSAFKKFKDFGHYVFGIFGLAAMIYTCSITYFTSGIWMASHNELLEGYQYGMFKVSTSYMRSVSKLTCSADKVPCLIYLTLPENSINEMFVNFHINLDSCPDRVWSPSMFYVERNQFGSKSAYLNTTPIKSEFESLPTETYEMRNIFTTYLKGLKQNTEYAFMISLDPKNYGSDVYYFKTFDPNNITIINGGDIGINKESREMNQVGLSDIGADLIMVGGDISYDNNFPEWYRATDQILLEVPHAQKDINSNKEYNFTRLIPMIKSTGNHDMGVNSVNNAKIIHNKHQPLFKHYYPQNTFKDNVPNRNHRREYFHHVIGEKLLILSLDSAYNTKIKGEQLEWMKEIFKKYKELPIKIVHYHEPIYPSWKYDENIYTNQTKMFWVPLFDKYNVTIAFENHSHRLKRTYPLRNSIPVDKGTYYIGDGAWGAVSSNWERTNVHLIKKDEVKNHVWVIHINKNSEIEVNAIGKDGKILDSLKILPN